MGTLSEILKFTLPSALMLLGVYLIIYRFLDFEKHRFDTERQQAMRKEIFPVRMQAYERIILLLERISPNQLILRINKYGLSVAQFHAMLLQSIRDEFDHNLSQQVYISSKSWELTRSAREELIRLINTASGNLEPDAPAAELASKVLELYSGLEHDPVSRAVEFVKQEARAFL